MNSVCVYCGSSPGGDPVYAEATKALARTLAERGLRVVYGGASAGLMGVLADTALAHGAEVAGFKPHTRASLAVAPDPEALLDRLVTRG